MSRQKMKLFIISFILFFITTQLIIYWNCYHSKLDGSARNIETNQSIHKKSVFIVLLWTRYFEKDFEINGWTSEGLKCGLKNLCIFTKDRNALNESSAVVFHWIDLIAYPKVVFPKYRRNNQRWILFSRLPPVYEERKFKSRLMDLDNKINWTMTYRRDSDIYAPYALISKKLNNSIKEKIVSLEYKTKQCATVVKQCETDSRRENYIKELKNFIDVDVYGNCSDTKDDCLDLELKDCHNLIEREYKFFLSFENGI